MSIAFSFNSAIFAAEMPKSVHRKNLRHCSRGISQGNIFLIAIENFAIFRQPYDAVIFSTFIGVDDDYDALAQERQQTPSPPPSAAADSGKYKLPEYWGAFVMVGEVKYENTKLNMLCHVKNFSFRHLTFH
jgi:hypothetical protein